MIFVSIGTHKQQFDRLLLAIDNLIEKKVIKEMVVAQIGHSTYNPKKYHSKKFFGLDEFDKNIKACSIFITHAGEGNVGTALQYEKKMIIIPRLERFGEHTNNHQLELADAIKKEKQAIVIDDVSEIEKALKDVAKLKIRKTEHAKRIIRIIEKEFEK